MKQAYLISRGLDEFAAAREQFGQLSEVLRSPPNLEREHGEIEELIWQEVQGLLRRLLQGHLDLRAALEPEREHVIGGDGVIRTHRRAGCTRTVMSLFGIVGDQVESVVQVTRIPANPTVTGGTLHGGGGKPAGPASHPTGWRHTTEYRRSWVMPPDNDETGSAAGNGVLPMC